MTITGVRIVKPTCGNKIKGNKTVTLVKKNEVITNDGKLSQTCTVTERIQAS